MVFLCLLEYQIFVCKFSYYLPLDDPVAYAAGPFSLEIKNKHPPVLPGNDKNALEKKNLYVIISEGLATVLLKIAGGFYQMKN